MLIFRESGSAVLRRAKIPESKKNDWLRVFFPVIYFNTLLSFLSFTHYHHQLIFLCRHIVLLHTPPRRPTYHLPLPNYP